MIKFLYLIIFIIININFAISQEQDAVYKHEVINELGVNYIKKIDKWGNDMLIWESRKIKGLSFPVIRELYVFDKKDRCTRMVFASDNPKFVRELLIALSQGMKLLNSLETISLWQGSQSTLSLIDEDGVWYINMEYIFFN